MLLGNSTTKEEHMTMRVQSLFSKFGVMENPTISNYISSIPDTLSEAISILLSSKFSENYSANEYTFANRKRLGQHVKHFHAEANPLSPDLSHSIVLVHNPP